MAKADITPTTAQVAVLLRGRTRDQYGNLVGDFTAATSPDTDGANGCILEAVDEVASQVGEDFADPDDLAAAMRLVIMLAAANIEMSYWPEQSAQNNSMYDKLMKRYSDRLTTFKADLSQTDEIVEEVNAGPETAGFPPPQGWGWRRW